MKKILLTLLLLPFSTTFLHSATVNKPQWRQTSNSHYDYFVTSIDNSNITAFLIREELNKHKTMYLDFKLQWKDGSCEKGETRRYVFHVNDKAIKFDAFCNSEQDFIFSPADYKKGNQLIFDKFRHAKNKDVKFVGILDTKKDIVFHIPSRNFRKYYKAAKEAIKPAD